MTAPRHTLAAFRAAHDRAWRDPATIVSGWAGAGTVDPRLLAGRVRGAFWETLAAHAVTLLVTREYEHLVLALRAGARGPAVSYLPLPHPNGVAVDARRGIVHVASTRNPNQVFDLVPATTDTVADPTGSRPLVPVRTRFFPGGLYLHDLALIGGVLHANAVGQDAVVRLGERGDYTRVWWPRCVERRGRPVVDGNRLQLNSIAAGATLAASYFTASTDAPGGSRPGHRNFPVDGRGVVFSGRTREPIARGLTRPHSARLRRGRVWVDNSGYGELGVAERGRFTPVVRLPGWTRGLAFHRGVAFVGTSRVLPRFRHYAPGLDVDRSACGVHAVELASGRVLGSLVWPYGNQIFAVEPLPVRFATGLPFAAGARRSLARDRALFYEWETRP
ncbi:MAG: DUF4915 domain-containing protein [Candidatus Binatia bacterium]